VSEARTPEEDTIEPKSDAMPHSRVEGDSGPTPEEEMRGAQPRTDSPEDSVDEHELRTTRESDEYHGPDPDDDVRGDAADEDQGT
jgi:hypothetical protein